ncbi:RagB/SusD family nutrient uptake outer membrane protein [Phocaeicola massiliensis]|nr:RagB/SusD family nutrient uptake outer membrane protein [Phocaeicola massiliensis]MBT9894014.1 RagB/SusD family nutrient uptake outer membrane protein [Phocaeicola massiliensis]
MGKVEKGPMIRGSHVDMRTLDEYMTPTGSFYSATIDNNLGDFNYGALKINSPYAQLTADGYFFNEIDGELSEGTIKLDAIVDLKDNSTINVNVLTHLKSKRIHHLITTKGMTFKEANAQAQKELLTQFGLQQYASKDASQFSLTSGDDASGALIAISSLVLTDRSDAEIVEYLSILSNEFGKEGAFSQETKKRIQSGKNYLNARLDRISENIKSRYKELGLEVKVKDLAYYFDWDNDGIAGNELDESESVTLSTTEINVPKEGGEYTISIVSDKPYYLNPPSFDSDSDSGLQELPQDNVIEENYFGGLYEPGANLPTPSIKYNKTIENNTITIKIEPAQFKKDLSTTFTVYNARGKVAATVTIKQSGDKNYWVKHDPVRLGDAGEHVVLGIMSIMRDAVSKQLHLQTGYIHQENFRDPVPFRPYDGEIGNIWGRYYTAINQWLTMKDVDANQLNCYQSFIDTHLALAYYQLSSRWGGIPFIMQRPNDAHIFLPRTDEAEVLSRVENMLFDAMGDLDEHRYDAFQDANSMLFVSKNVARILLAFVYCNQKKFDKALPLLEEVIRRGEYHLEYSQATEYQNNAECILGYYPEMSSAQKIFPCLDYKDVILTAAECLYHTGNTPKAKEYINQVCEYKNLTADQSDVLKAIASLHYQINSPSYMNFIRRNGLGESFMGLSPNNLYQLLWPIPSGELDKNPQLTQNPGYY